MSFGLVLGGFLLGFSGVEASEAEGFVAVQVLVKEEEGFEEGLGSGLGLGLGLGFWGEKGQSRDQWPGLPHLKQPVGAASPSAFCILSFLLPLLSLQLIADMLDSFGGRNTYGGKRSGGIRREITYLASDVVGNCLLFIFLFLFF